MRFTAASTLMVIGDRVPPALVGPPAWEAVLQVARLLPAALLRAFYLECRLAAHAPRVDWIVKVEPPGGEILAGRNPRIQIPEGLRTDPVWTRLGDVCSSWADDALLRRSLTMLWLEFDIESPSPPPCLRPSIFVGLAEPLGADRTMVVDRLLGQLCPELPASTRESLHRALASAPFGAAVPFVGVMLGRASTVVRLYFAGLSARSLVDEIRRMGWCGQLDGLTEVVQALQSPLRGAAPHMGMVHIDVDRGVLPGVGIEYPFRRLPQLRGRLAERWFLGRAVELELCSQAKCESLLMWPGREVTTLPHELWPSVVTRRVNCVKLVYEPGQSLEMKAYLLTYWDPLASARRTGADAHRMSRQHTPALT